MWLQEEVRFGQLAVKVKSLRCYIADPAGELMAVFSAQWRNLRLANCSPLKALLEIAVNGGISVKAQSHRQIK